MEKLRENHKQYSFIDNLHMDAPVLALHTPPLCGHQMQSGGPTKSDGW